MEERKQILNEVEAAEVVGMVPQTLAVWRSTGRYGLPFIKVGRAVRYRRADLEAWLAKRTGTSVASINA